MQIFDIWKWFRTCIQIWPYSYLKVSVYRIKYKYIPYNNIRCLVILQFYEKDSFASRNTCGSWCMRTMLVFRHISFSHIINTSHNQNCLDEKQNYSQVKCSISSEGSSGWKQRTGQMLGLLNPNNFVLAIRKR